MSGRSTHATDTAYSAGRFTDRDVARFVAVLADHALVETRCDHDAKTDTPVCNCAVVDLGAHATVQKAKEAWALHVWGVLRGGG